MNTPLEITIGTLLRQRGMKLVVAESCTGGLISDRITDVPGSSDYYLGGVTAYANEVKRRVLGVSAETLRSYGAVSGETAIEMARGARFALADETPVSSILGISATGIAGPSGGSPDKPVGLVWIGLSAPEGESAWQFVWEFDRSGNKAASAEQAIRLAVDYLRGTLSSIDSNH
ncbi:CinA family protein [Longilinea arvoryzae]|uniref:CinA family protein n=1 Tax=Longilinea arvoryzae TaxID=360412 RepID=UPI001F42F459|nr:CinA family protein [Longilinea arvoryzae]